MATMRRVNGSIKIVDKDLKPCGWYTGVYLPIVLDMAAEVYQGQHYVPRHFLTLMDDELVYLHEEAESVVPA